MLQISGATSYRKCIRKDKCGEEMKENAQAAEFLLITTRMRLLLLAQGTGH
jgi:hypothetical protein